MRARRHVVKTFFSGLSFLSQGDERQSRANLLCQHRVTSKVCHDISPRQTLAFCATPPLVARHRRHGWFVNSPNDARARTPY
jgi:hypothetical protein